jgi:hypothetical protein
LPTASARSPAARSIAVSMCTVVVLPLVPVRVIQGAAPNRWAQPPGQLDLAPDRHTRRRCGGEQRLVGTPAGRGDDQLRAVRQRLDVLCAQPDVGSEDAQDLAPLVGGGRLRTVDHDDPGTPLEQRVAAAKAAAAEARHDDVEPGPVGSPVRERVQAHSPTTHSA